MAPRTRASDRLGSSARRTRRTSGPRVATIAGAGAVMAIPLPAAISPPRLLRGGARGGAGAASASFEGIVVAPRRASPLAPAREERGGEIAYPRPLPVRTGRGPGGIPLPASCGEGYSGAVAASSRPKGVVARRRAPPPAPPRKNGEGSRKAP